MLYYYLFVLMIYSVLNTQRTNAWDTPSSNQYHIQTDEGPERYFRYQTDSGQYRKEKRLEDGTVIGSYAWIDDNGFLRQRDYIADDAGYRILKTKNVFVGRNVPVGQAVKSVAKYPTTTGPLSNSRKRPIVNVPYNTATSYLPSSFQSSSPLPIVSSTTRPPYEIKPNSIASGIIASTEAPVVEITPNSVYSTSIYPVLLPQNNFTRHINSDNYVSSTPLSYYQSTTPSPQHYALSTLKYIQPTETPLEAVPQLYTNYNEVPKEVDYNSLENNPYNTQIGNSHRFHNGPTYPLDRNGKPYFGQNLQNDYNSQYSTYDGNSVTNDGFRYYIPRAYHEEETLPGDKRSGSFGYIDPFGIRRVIYYNTAPGTGFQHRKNNRYVGFDATPFDPRPY